MLLSEQPEQVVLLLIPKKAWPLGRVLGEGGSRILVSLSARDSRFLCWVTHSYCKIKL